MGMNQKPLEDLTQATALARMNNEHLPSTSTVWSETNPVHYLAYGADLNVDQSTDALGLGTITCPPDDCAMPPYSLLVRWSSQSTRTFSATSP